MKNLLRGALTLLLLAVASARPQIASGQAPSDATVTAANQHPISEAQLRTYLEESSLLSTIQEHIQEEIDRMRKSSQPWIPDAVWTTMKEKSAAIDVVKTLLPVYQKYYTEQDGQAMSLMFEGPTGRALVVASKQATETAKQEVSAIASGDKAPPPVAPVGNVAELTRKRMSELTPEQSAAIRQMRLDTEVKTLDGLKVEEEQNDALAKAMNDIMQATMATHRKEMIAAQRAYNVKH